MCVWNYNSSAHIFKPPTVSRLNTFVTLTLAFIIGRLLIKHFPASENVAVGAEMSWTDERVGAKILWGKYEAKPLAKRRRAGWFMWAEPYVWHHKRRKCCQLVSETFTITEKPWKLHFSCHGAFNWNMLKKKKIGVISWWTTTSRWRRHPGWVVSVPV